MDERTNSWAYRVGRSFRQAHDQRSLESIGSNNASPVVPEVALRKRATSEAEYEMALETIERIDRGDQLEGRHVAALEAIIEPENRPVIDIVNDSYSDVPWNWPMLGEADVRAVIERVIPSIGRVELPNHPSIPYGGTAFFVGDGLMMTNRHVAELFANGLGDTGLSFKPGRSSAVDLKQEVLPGPALVLRVDAVRMIHPYWDCAILQVSGDITPRTPLKLMEHEPRDLKGRPVIIVGYPAMDPRGDVSLQQRIFRVFQKKRLQPGTILGYGRIDSYGEEVQALTHDISTLGGNSGSAVIDLYSGDVVGLHFAGMQRVANYAVPAWELALDGRIIDTGVNFVARPQTTSAPPWEHKWQELASRPTGRLW
jgi:endonuclease G